MKKEKKIVKVNWKVLIIIILASVTAFVTLIALAQAESFGTFKQGSSVELKQFYNATGCNILSVMYPNSSLAISNETMSQNGFVFNYTLDGNYTQEKGKYLVNGECDGNLWNYEFYITSTGTTTSAEHSIISIGILVFAAAAMFFFGLLGLKFMDGNKTFPIGLFFLVFSLIIAVYGMYLGVIYIDDYYSALSGVQGAIFSGMLFGLVGIVFISLLFLILMTLKEIKERKSLQRYGEDYDTKTKMYKY